MPELPDVEVFRRFFDAHALGQAIRSVEVRNVKILEHTTPEKLERALVSHSFTETRRHGKHLFAHLDQGPWLALHFGMTGFLRYYASERGIDHTRMLIAFRNGNSLAYDDSRMFGRITLTDSVENYIRAKELGPDALAVSQETFRELIAGRKTPLKIALMDQRTIAGLGNIYADEVLFQARLHPLRNTRSLSETDLENLYRSVRQVLDRAVKSHADPDEMPDSFLIPHRRAGAPCPLCGGVVKKVTIAGRSAYYCDCQK